MSPQAALGTPWRVYVDTVRHLQPRQVIGRARRVTRRLRAPSASGLELGEGPIPPGRLRLDIPAADALRRARQVCEGVFSFLNSAARYPGGAVWDDVSKGRLWRFHLHYFDYALDLALAFRETGDPAFRDALASLVGSWISANPPARGDAWHPFPASVRIVNWIEAEAIMSEGGKGLGAGEDLEGRFLESLGAQAAWLARNIEYDVGGNHLIKNAKALLFAGTRFGGPAARRWRERALRVLAAEAGAQVLADGCHYERSLMYHAQVLGDLLDSLGLIPSGEPAREPIQRACDVMAGFLRAMLHPDGSLPLFNDSVAFPERPSVKALSGWPESPAVPGTGPAPGASGFGVMRSGPHLLMIDCGAIGPDHLPAHAHSELFSFELSSGGQRLVTNSGTYTYEAGAWRDSFRGTAAHNTVQVNGEEQSHLWASFRAGRRARLLEAHVSGRSEGQVFRGRCAGFGSNRIEHARQIWLVPGPCWVFVDEVRARAEGETLDAASRIHLHPDAAVSLDQEAATASRGDAGIRIVAFGGARTGIEEGWFSEDFGLKVPSKVVRMSRQGGSPILLGFVLAPIGLAVSVRDFTGGPGTWRLVLLAGESVRTLGPGR